MHRVRAATLYYGIHCTSTQPTGDQRPAAASTDLLCSDQRELDLPPPSPIPLANQSATTSHLQPPPALTSTHQQPNKHQLSHMYVCCSFCTPRHGSNFHTGNCRLRSTQSHPHIPKLSTYTHTYLLLYYTLYKHIKLTNTSIVPSEQHICYY